MYVIYHNKGLVGQHCAISPVSAQNNRTYQIKVISSWIVIRTLYDHALRSIRIKGGLGSNTDFLYIGGVTTTILRVSTEPIKYII